MTWPRHNKLVVNGKMGSTGETWSYSLKFKSDFGLGPDRLPNDWDRDDVRDALVVFHGAGWTHNECVMTGFKGYQMNENNRVELNSMVSYEWSPGVASPVYAGQHKHPYQCALVVGLESTDRSQRQPGVGPGGGKLKDPGRFGRLYLPLPVFPVTDGRIGEYHAQLTADAFKVLVESLKNAMYSPDYVGETMVNVSPYPTGSPDGTIKAVDRYRVGRVLDTMQSRRKGLDESYIVVNA